MLYQVSSLLLTIPPHTHSGKTYFSWSQRALSNPSFGSPLKRKGFLMVFPSSGKLKGIKSEKCHNLSSQRAACFAQCGCAGKRHRQSRSELMLSTDVTLAPCMASAACACKGARAGHSKIPQGEGKAPGIFKPQLLHLLYSRP